VPRVRAEFEKLKKPIPKREVKRLSDSELAKQKKIAEKERAEFAKKNAMAEKPKESKKEEPAVVPPYVFDNGAMVSELNELKDALQPMGPDILRSAITGQNTLASWTRSALKNNSLADALSRQRARRRYLMQ